MKLLPFCILLFVAFACGDKQQDTSTTVTPTPSGRLVANTKVSDPRYRYLGGVSVYVVNLFKEDEKLARLMAAAPDSKDLNGIRNALNRSRALEDEDYRNLMANDVPKSEKALHARVQKMHRDHSDVFDEYLAYFQDSKLEHIPRASKKFKTVLQYTGETVKLLNKSM